MRAVFKIALYRNSFALGLSMLLTACAVGPD